MRLKVPPSLSRFVFLEKSPDLPPPWGLFRAYPRGVTRWVLPLGRPPCFSEGGRRFGTRIFGGGPWALGLDSRTCWEGSPIIGIVYWTGAVANGSRFLERSARLMGFSRYSMALGCVLHPHRTETPWKCHRHLAGNILSTGPHSGAPSSMGCERRYFRPCPDNRAPRLLNTV